jgi:hypothetical protein
MIASIGLSLEDAFYGQLMHHALAYAFRMIRTAPAHRRRVHPLSLVAIPAADALRVAPRSRRGHPMGDFKFTLRRFCSLAMPRGKTKGCVVLQIHAYLVGPYFVGPAPACG